MNEEFEKWMNSRGFVESQGRLRDAFLAGAVVMLEKAKETLCANCEAEGLNVRCDLCTDIAAIRKLEVT